MWNFRIQLLVVILPSLQQYRIQYWFALEYAVRGFNLSDHTITGNVLDYSGTGSSSVPSPHSSLSVSQYKVQDCALLCNKGCDQILTTPLCNLRLWTSYLLTAVWALYGHVKHWIDPWTWQLYKWWLYKTNQYVSPHNGSLVPRLFFPFQNRQPGNKATTVGYSESTAVGLYMYLRQSTEIGQGMTTSYMY